MEDKLKKKKNNSNRNYRTVHTIERKYNYRTVHTIERINTEKKIQRKKYERHTVEIKEIHTRKKY